MRVCISSNVECWMCGECARVCVYKFRRRQATMLQQLPATSCNRGMQHVFIYKSITYQTRRERRQHGGGRSETPWHALDLWLWSGILAYSCHLASVCAASPLKLFKLFSNLINSRLRRPPRFGDINNFVTRSPFHSSCQLSELTIFRPHLSPARI